MADGPVNVTTIRPLSGRNSFRDDLGIPDNVTVGLYSANKGAKQGLETVLDAARLLISDDSSVR